MEPAQKVHLAVDCLSELLNVLCPDPNPDVFTLESFLYVYKLHGLNETAVRHIEQTQRVNRAVGDFRQIGLNEFHIGLVYLYWEAFHAAEKQFDSARRQWSIVNEPALLSLAHLGLGFAQELTFHYELALSSFSKARQNLGRIRFAAPADEYGRFRQIIEPCIDDAQKALRDLMVPLSGASPSPGHYQTAVPDLPDPSDFGENHAWFKVKETYSQGDFFTPKLLMLVNKSVSSTDEYTRSDWIVVGSRKIINNCVQLTPLASSSSPNVRQDRIYLATSQYEGPFTVDPITGEVTLGSVTSVTLIPQAQKLAVGSYEVIGIVVGFWNS